MPIPTFRLVPLHGLGFAGLVILVACSGPLLPVPPGNDACGASRYAPLIGSKLDRADFAGHPTLRIIPPGSAVTMDYSPTRLNVETDARDVITRINCG